MKKSSLLLAHQLSRTNNGNKTTFNRRTNPEGRPRGNQLGPLAIQAGSLGNTGLFLVAGYL
jgi:hypothetical protein